MSVFGLGDDPKKEEAKKTSKTASKQEEPEDEKCEFC